MVMMNTHAHDEDGGSSAPMTLRTDVRRALKSLFMQCLKPGMSVYDIGCGEKPFASFFKNMGVTYIGVDVADGFYDASHIDIIGSAYAVPLDDGKADAVLSSQVLEHLEKPVDAIREAHRILKAGGLFFASFPFLYPVHAAPHDYLRYTEYFIRNTFEAQGFELVEHKAIGGFWYCAGLFTGLYLQVFDRGILKKLKIAKILIFLIKSLLYGIHILEGFLLNCVGKNRDTFRARWTVNYVLVAEKK